VRKKTRTGSIAAAAAFAMLVTGCSPFAGPLPGNPAPSTYYIHHLSGQGTWPLNLDLGDEPRDVYLTFVNPDRYDTWGSLTVSGSVMGGEPVEEPSAGEPSARIVPEADPNAARKAGAVVSPQRAPTPRAITEFNQNPFGGRGRSAASLRLLERSPAPPLLDTEGSSSGGTFSNMNLSSVPATCRKVVKDVGVAGGGTRTLNIWVADNCWYSGGSRAALVRPEMVDAMAGQFLAAGSFNDIYDWVTAMLGAEWGPHGQAGLIQPNGEITILLCDIANDNAAGGYVGYFWSKDNYTTEYEPASSERVMFTIDAVSYATGDGSWDPGDFWPEEIFSTLAHEFQHMIHFYQRGVLRDAMASGDTWINEMASLVVEDLLADKMEVIGPRGVDTELLYPDGSAGASGNTKGRLGEFIYYPSLSLSDWGYDLESYSVAYAFGAWLARNYGGAELPGRLMQCSSTGPASIEDIVSQETGHGESFDRILQRWSAAVLLSGETDAPPGYRYNSGGFFASTLNGNAYRLGSIDLENYMYGGQVGPRMYPGGTTGTWTVGTSEHLATSIALYDATPVLQAAGVLAWTLDMPGGVIATVLVK
jgi:hypothetical protein